MIGIVPILQISNNGALWIRCCSVMKYCCAQPFRFINQSFDICEVKSEPCGLILWLSRNGFKLSVTKENLVRYWKLLVNRIYPTKKWASTRLRILTTLNYRTVESVNGKIMISNSNLSYQQLLQDYLIVNVFSFGWEWLQQSKLMILSFGWENGSYCCNHKW